ncbi:MAG TPA: acylphosphatase [Steroidobacteraceae bacterium]|nr:acylphosphatase [Steroidobacteraceae bacterium]
MVSKICWVSGRVQGVYYRGTAVSQARAAGISGYARNLPDGRVEVLVQGPQAAVEAFIQWLWIGSAAAKVTGVEVREVQAALRPGFTSE